MGQSSPRHPRPLGLPWHTPESCSSTAAKPVFAKYYLAVAASLMGVPCFGVRNKVYSIYSVETNFPFRKGWTQQAGVSSPVVTNPAVTHQSAKKKEEQKR